MNDKKASITLQLIKTDKNCYIKRTGGMNTTDLSKFLVNGIHPLKTFASGWFEIESEPTEIKSHLPIVKTNHRMALKAELLEQEGFSGTTLGKMKPEMPRDECMAYDEDDYEWYWKKEFRHLASLYELKHDEEQPDPEDIDFECELFCEIPDLDGYTGMKYVSGINHYCDNAPIFTNERVIKHRAIDQIIYPAIMLPSCTSTMGSEDFYRIVRFHVKQNIDYRYADITSDYDFCFTVEKRIVECKDYKASGNKPKNRREVRNKAQSKCVVFEMTPVSKKYRSYTPLPKIQAKNTKALKRKIDKYLRDLINYINEPIVVCEHCDGTGVHNPVKKFDHPEQ